MSEPLTITTQFADISQLAQGFVDRVGDEQLILPSPVPVNEGEWTQFIVYLADGTPAFAGVGQCVEMADNGEHAPANARYDLLLFSLGFEEDSRAVFNHLVLVKNEIIGSQSQPEGVEEENLVDGLPADDFGTSEIAEVDADELHSIQPSGEGIEAESIEDSQVENLPQPVDQDSIQTGETSAEVTADPAVAKPLENIEETSPTGAIIQMPVPDSGLSRPTIAQGWKPKKSIRPEPRPSSGLFKYNGNGLPLPQYPPRPDLDESLWVTKAVHPNDSKTAAVHPGGSPAYAVSNQYAAKSSVQQADDHRPNIVDDNESEAKTTGQDVAQVSGGMESQPPIAELTENELEETSLSPYTPETDLADNDGGDSISAFPLEIGTAEICEGELEEVGNENKKKG